MLKNKTHYVDDNFSIRTRKTWLFLAIIISLIFFIIGIVFHKEHEMFLGTMSVLTLIIVTIVKRLLLEFSDEYEDYVEDNTYSKNYELWSKKK